MSVFRRMLTAFWAALILLLVPAVQSYAAAVPASLYVQDQAGILSSGTSEKISRMGAALDRQTTAQIAVLTVSQVPDGDMDTYANQIFRGMKLGDSAKNNGILLLISTGDKKARIEVGYGLEGALNDAKAGRILDEYLIPAFQQGKDDEGVLAVYTALVKIVMQEYGVEKLQGNADVNTSAAQQGIQITWTDILLLAVVLGAVVLDMLFFGGVMTRSVWQILIWLILSRGGGGGGFGGHGRGGSSGGGGAGRGW
jgi:uncharacterized protein